MFEWCTHGELLMFAITYRCRVDKQPFKGLRECVYLYLNWCWLFTFFYIVSCLRTLFVSKRIKLSRFKGGRRGWVGMICLLRNGVATSLSWIRFVHTNHPTNQSDSMTPSFVLLCPTDQDECNRTIVEQHECHTDQLLQSTVRRGPSRVSPWSSVPPLSVPLRPEATGQSTQGNRKDGCEWSIGTYTISSYCSDVCAMVVVAWRETICPTGHDLPRTARSVHDKRTGEVLSLLYELVESIVA